MSDRIIVVVPRGGGSYLDRLYAAVGLDVPTALADWDERVQAWLDDYDRNFTENRLLEVFLDSAVYWFDQDESHERVVVAYGISTAPAGPRDASRIRGFPDVNVGVRNAMGDQRFVADRGHFLSHASGGELDINLFPQRTELNRGWSDEGKVFRRMEKEAAQTPGTFHFHRAMYNDETWIPDRLQYGVLQNDQRWWVEEFANK